MYKTISTYNGIVSKPLYEDFNNFKYSAVIVEPREHPALEFVLKNILDNLDNNWKVKIFHGNYNEKFLKNIITNRLNEYNYRIETENLNINNLSLIEYNKLVSSEEFYNKIPTEIFLIFETDSMICPQYKNYIYKYLDKNIDYLGAPWKDINLEGGNSGFSLRRKSKILNFIKNCEYKKGENTDIYFSSNCSKSSLNKLTKENSKNFSCETIYTNDSFGVHKPWLYLTPEQLNEKINSCTGLDKLIELNILY